MRLSQTTWILHHLYEIRMEASHRVQLRWRSPLGAVVDGVMVVELALLRDELLPHSTDTRTCRRRARPLAGKGRKLRCDIV